MERYSDWLSHSHICQQRDEAQRFPFHLIDWFEGSGRVVELRAVTFGG